MTEEWRDISGWEGYYQVSNQGQVRSVGRSIVTHNGTRTRWVPPRMLRLATSGNSKQRANGKGYAAACLARNSEKIFQRVNRLVLIAFVGLDAELPLACHRNGDSNDNRLSNLYWGTHRDNAIDSINHGVNQKSNQTQCVAGHEFNTDNTYINQAGHRRCRECRRRQLRDWRARQVVVAA